MAGVDLSHANGDDGVLAQPTRRRLFAALGELGGSAGTDALAERLGLHPNGIRTHLQRMRDAGVVTHRRITGPRGRPRDEWAIAAGARLASDAPRAYGLLARWLARAIPPTPARLREVEDAGREIGRELAVGAATEPAQVLGDVLAALGFAPEVQRRRQGGGVSCRLRNCPYRDSVRENRDVVCTLHRGITRGILDQVAPTATLERFVPHDPDQAGCEIDIDGLAPAT